jgi:DNA-binding transcriptional LysR family regulator
VDDCHEYSIVFQCNLCNQLLLMTTNVDLNLLHALDALLQEASVTKAAQRARLTTPAMSRALGRLRDTLGDELLVRAGRAMVLTPLAMSLRGRVHVATAESKILLAPTPAVRLEQVERTMAVRCNDAVAAVLMSPLVTAAASEAPRLRIRFVPEGEEDAEPLRDGRIDLDIGVIALTEPELRIRRLLHDRFVGVVRTGHALTRGRMSAKCFAEARHVAVSRRGKLAGPIDVELQKRALMRFVAATVPDFLAALHAVAESDLVTAAPSRVVKTVAHHLPLASFALPFAVPGIAISMVWHPRFDAEPAHRWLRRHVQAAITARAG